MMENSGDIPINQEEYSPKGWRCEVAMRENPKDVVRYPFSQYVVRGEMTYKSAKLLSGAGITNIQQLKRTTYGKIAEVLGVETIYDSDVWEVLN